MCSATDIETLGTSSDSVVLSIGDLLGVELAVERLERKHLSHSALGAARNCLANVLHLKGELAPARARAMTKK